MTDDEKKPASVFSDAMLVAAVSATVYAMAYVHEYAYCSAFAIPSDYIDLPLSVIAAVLIGMVTVIANRSLWPTPLERLSSRA
jgi:hypothetical protein